MDVRYVDAKCFDMDGDYKKIMVGIEISLDRSPTKGDSPQILTVIDSGMTRHSGSNSIPKSSGISPTKIVMKFPTNSNPQIIKKSQIVTSIRPAVSNIPIAPSNLKSTTITTVSSSVSKVQCVKLIYNTSNTQAIAKAQKNLSTADNNLTLTAVTGGNVNKAASGSHRPILPATQQSSRQQPIVLSQANVMIVPRRNDAPVTESFSVKPIIANPQYIISSQLQPALDSSDANNFVPVRTESVLTKPNYTSNQYSQEGTTKQRKPCNCTKSQCLKLYCDCFTNGEFCNNCNCTNCANNLKHEAERQRAIKACLERNPFAFHPKIGKGGEGEMVRQHNKGCNCKRSGCLKNYCECYEAKILCSSLCKCVSCKNFEESPERKTLMHLADAAEVRVQQQIAATTKLTSHIDLFPARRVPVIMGKRLPYTFMTNEVIEATCACLIAQTEEAERIASISEADIERLILEEFGRCLSTIIDSANRTSADLP